MSSSVPGFRRAGWLAVAMVGVLVAASACSSSSGKGTAAGAATTSTAADAGALGTPNAATGSTVTIGLMTEAGSGALDAQSQLAADGAKIGTSYVNDYLGGLGGHKIDLFVCGNKSTPAGALDCANQFVEKKVSAVVWPFTGQGGAVPIIAAAGIPMIISSGASSAELTTPGVFVLTGGFAGTLGAYAQDAKERGLKKFAMIVTDVPAATQGAKALGGIAFKNAGVGYDVIAAAPGTADLTPQLQQAISSGADAVGVTGDVTFCTSFLQAYDALALKIAKYVLSTCNDESVVKAIPKALDGAYETTLTGPGPDDAVYAGMVKKYGGGKIDPNPIKSSGVFTGVRTVVDVAIGLKGYTGDASAASLLTAYKTASGTIFGSGGLTFKCDGTAIPLLKNICSAGFQMAVLNGDGTAKTAKRVDASAMFKS